MKKIKLMTLVIIIMILQACNLEQNNNENIIEISEDEQFLKELEELYEVRPVPIAVIQDIDEKFDSIENELIKEKILELGNMAVNKIVSNSDKEYIRNYFEIKDIESDILNDIKYFKYLSEDTKKLVLDACGYSIRKKDFLENKGYKIEYLNDYAGVEVGTSKIDIFDILENKGSYYNDSLIGKWNFLINVDNRVVIDFAEGNNFDGSLVRRIFKVIDSTGETINPDIAFNGYEDYIAEELKEYNRLKEKEAQERLEKIEPEQKESKTIRLGMTKSDVRERWGEPKDINRTITEYGVSEQWVYSGYRYLYFEDGILTTIQD